MGSLACMYISVSVLVSMLWAGLCVSGCLCVRMCVCLAVFPRLWLGSCFRWYRFWASKRQSSQRHTQSERNRPVEAEEKAEGEEYGSAELREPSRRTRTAAPEPVRRSEGGMQGGCAGRKLADALGWVAEQTKRRRYSRRVGRRTWKRRRGRKGGGKNFEQQSADMHMYAIQCISL